MSRPPKAGPRGHSHTTVEVGSGPDTLSEYRIRAPSSLHCTHSETYVAWALCHNVQLDTGWTSHLRIGHGNHLKFIVDSHVRLHLLVRRSGRLRSVSRRPYPVCLTKRFISYDNSPAAGRNDPGFRGSGRQRRHGS